MNVETRVNAESAITRLILEYCAAIDEGRLDDMARLFTKGTWIPSPTMPLKGHEQVAGFLGSVILYDGVPRTRHSTTNIRIDLADDAQSATADSYVIIYQSVKGSSPFILLQGAYKDTFLVDEAGQWHFHERHVTADGMGDTTKHLRAS